MIELRLIASYPHHWGPGKVHAAAWTHHEIWGPDWYALCTGDHLHGKPPQEATSAPLTDQVTCKRCLSRMAANPLWTTAGAVA